MLPPTSTKLAATAALQQGAPSPPRTATTTVSLIATLGLSSACWVLVVGRMNDMDMGVATRLGSFWSFLVLWVPMMAAMMLPGAVPALLRRARSEPLPATVSWFIGSYLLVWALVGVAVYSLYRPHGTAAAGAVAIAAGAYELTPLKRRFRRLCREGAGSGIEYGICCVGSSLGLMVAMVALGVMSVTWMVVAAVVVLAQKLLAPRGPVDVTLALGIIAGGILALVAPSAVPGLMASM